MMRKFCIAIAASLVFCGAAMAQFWGPTPIPLSNITSNLTITKSQPSVILTGTEASANTWTIRETSGDFSIKTGAVNSLDIKGSTAEIDASFISSNRQSFSLLSSSGTAGVGVYFNNNSTNQVEVGLDDSVGTASGSATSGYFGTTSAFPVVIMTNGTPRLTISSAGVITITAPGAAGAGALFMCLSIGEVVQTSTVSCLGSDEAMKAKLKALAPFLEKTYATPEKIVLKMQPMSWVYNSHAGKELNGTPGWGFTAQRSAKLERDLNLPHGVLAHYAKDGHPDNIWDRGYLAVAIAEIQDLINQFMALRHANDNGLTTLDRTTKRTYCLFVDRGAMKIAKGVCK